MSTTLHQAQRCDNSPPNPLVTTPSELWWDGPGTSGVADKRFPPRLANLAKSSATSNITSANDHNKSPDQSQEQQGVESNSPSHPHGSIESNLGMKKTSTDKEKKKSTRKNKRWRIFKDDGSFIRFRPHQLKRLQQREVQSTPHTVKGCSRGSQSSRVSSRPVERSGELWSKDVKQRCFEPEAVNLRYPNKKSAQRKELD